MVDVLRRETGERHAPYGLPLLPGPCPSGRVAGPEPDEDPRLRLLIDELLKHSRPKVRLHAHRTSRAMLCRTAYLHHTAAAREGLTRMGTSAVPALRHAADHARPDKRPLFEEVLHRITASAGGT
ncbi:hypothetical protein ABZX62_10055 [Streptomyces flavidovirens]|uniref:hypothetical protein n=1 Tax=Streptomyces flavidovirens TaxID=67298 RepID=UPI0033B3AD69